MVITHALFSVGLGEDVGIGIVKIDRTFSLLMTDLVVVKGTVLIVRDPVNDLFDGRPLFR